jgi:hypothetical protein
MEKVFKEMYVKLYNLGVYLRNRWHDQRHFKKLQKNLQRRLKRSDKRLCDNYAKKVFGHKKYASSLYTYTLINGEFKEGWVPVRFFFDVVIPNTSMAHAKLGGFKTLSSMMFRSEAFPNLLYFMGGNFYDIDYNPIPLSQVEDKLFSENKRVVYKQNSSGSGQGVRVYDREHFSLQEIISEGVLQRYVEQHDFFNAFSSSGVATIRIFTVSEINEEGEALISVRGSYLRLPRENDTHVISTSAVKVPIDKKSGVLGDWGCLPSWIKIDKHPDSNVTFSGLKIPMWKECIEKVRTLHRKASYLGSIGWDVIVSKTNEVEVMEMNSVCPGIAVIEALQGPCFSDLHWEKYANTRRV